MCLEGKGLKLVRVKASTLSSRDKERRGEGRNGKRETGRGRRDGMNRERKGGRMEM